MPIQLAPSTSFMTNQVSGMHSTAQSAAAKYVPVRMLLSSSRWDAFSPVFIMNEPMSEHMTPTTAIDSGRNMPFQP